MMRRSLLTKSLLACLLAAAPSVCLAGQEQSLLTSDGTLHVVSSGRAIDLGVGNVPPESYLLEWTSLAQDGTENISVLPDSVSSAEAQNLQLAYDDQTQTLLLLWSDGSALSLVHVSVLRSGTWTTSPLLPSQGISLAYNPKMLITHKAITYRDANDAVISETASILSIVWWEEALIGQARLATIFLDEQSFDPTNLSIYDLPTLAGGPGGAVSYDGVPTGAYQFPSVQADGLSGAFLASYADLHDQRHRILGIDFPIDWGKPSDPTDMNWKRRHIPIVGVAMDGPVARMAPDALNTLDGVHTMIGRGYRPTLSWTDPSGATVQYTRLGDTDWAPLSSVAVTSQMTYAQAQALVLSMAGRN